MWGWVVVGVLVVVSVVVDMVCCMASGRAAQWEEDNLGIRRS
jgi:hypothetical protein